MVPSSPPSEKLYCICHQPYDEEKFYIQCDSCEDWFHGTCVNITETQSDQIEKYFCQECAQLGNVTIWRDKCEAPGCKEPSRDMSKYCSPKCGLVIANARLKELYPKIPKRSTRSAILTTQKIDYRPHIIKYKEHRRKLRNLIRTIERYQLLVDDAVEKRQANPSVCGYDFRLTEDWIIDMNFDQYDEITDFSISEPRLCQETKCQLHTDWHKMKPLSVELLLKEQLKKYQDYGKQLDFYEKALRE